MSEISHEEIVPEQEHLEMDSESPSSYPSKKDALQIVDSVVKGGRNPKPLIDRLISKKKEFLLRETK